jgi:hypothetical protein
MLAVAVVAIAAVSLATFALPQADDFVLAVEGRERGPAGYARHVYAIWSGRWFGHALIAALLASGDPTRSYPWLIAGLLACQLLGLHALVRMVVGAEPSRAGVLGYALGLFALLFASRPSPAETVYWVSGAVPYQLSVSSCIFLVALLVRPPPVGRTGAWLGRGLAVSLLAVCIPGLHELVGLAALLVVAVGSAVAWRVGSRTLPLWVVALGCAAVGLLVVVLAPGNELRGRFFTDARDVEHALGWLARDAARYARVWLLDPKLLAATTLLAVLPALARLRPAWIEWRSISWRGIIPCAWLAILAAALFAPRWATGGWVPRRVVDTNYAIFVIGWLLSVFVWTRHAEETRVLPDGVRLVARWAALGVFAAALLLTGNTPTAMADLTQRASAWHRALGARYALARRAGRDGASTLVVPRPPPRPRLFTVLELTPDPDHWANRGFARFFGVRSARVQAKRGAR